MLAGPGPARGRIHSLWALDAIRTAAARGAIRGALRDADPEIQAQAARSAGIRRDRAALLPWKPCWAMHPPWFGARPRSRSGAWRTPRHCRGSSRTCASPNRQSPGPSAGRSARSASTSPRRSRERSGPRPPFRRAGALRRVVVGRSRTGAGGRAQEPARAPVAGPRGRSSGRPVLPLPGMDRWLVWPEPAGRRASAQDRAVGRGGHGGGVRWSGRGAARMQIPPCAGRQWAD